MNSKSRFGVALLVVAGFLFTAVPSAWSTGKVRGLTQEGMIALGNRKYDLAEKKLKEASKVAKVSGPLYTEYAESLLNLGLLYDRKKEVEKSAAKYKEALAIYKKAYGEKTLQAAKCFHGLGELYRHQKSYIKSIPYYRKALKIREVAAPNHTDLADTAYGMAKTFLALKQYAEAQPLLKQVVSIQEKAYGANDKRMVKTLYQLANSYEGSNKTNLAIPAYRKVIGILKGAYGEKNPRIASTYEHIGSAYARTLHYKKAEIAYENALEIREYHKRKYPKKYARCIKSYIKVLRKLKKRTAVKEWEARLAELN